LYVNDMRNTFGEEYVYQFADDTSIVVADRDLKGSVITYGLSSYERSYKTKLANIFNK
jgi:transketolase C-terminal domain/subunit